jgi:hypothetical protein
MVRIPVLHEMTGESNLRSSRGKPILQMKELEPDWERYNAWRASLVESYTQWLKRRRQFGLDDVFDR